jgi:hypothetical protein
MHSLIHFTIFKFFKQTNETSMLKLLSLKGITNSEHM